MTATLLRASLRHLARYPWESALSILEIALGVAVVVSIAHVGTRAVILAMGLVLVVLGTLAGALARCEARSQAASV